MCVCVGYRYKKLVGRQECHSKADAISCITATKTHLFTAAFDNLIKCWDIQVDRQTYR